MSVCQALILLLALLWGVVGGFMARVAWRGGDRAATTYVCCAFWPILLVLLMINIAIELWRMRGRLM